MPDNFISSLLLSLLTALHSTIVLGGLGAIILATSTEAFANSGKAAFLNKLSEQAARLGAWLLLYLGLVLAGGLWAVIYLFPQRVWLWAMDWRLVALIAGIPAATILFGLLYKWLRKALKNMRGLHILIGVLASLSAVCALLGAVMIKRHILRLAGEDKVYPTLEGLVKIQIVSPETWAHFAHLVMLALCSGGALVLVFLLLRRTRDDYGRDYYAYTVRFASKWAAVFGLLTALPWAYLLLIMWPGIKVMPHNAPVIGLAAAYSALLLLAAIFFFIVGRAEMPLRHKPIIITGLIAVWLGLSCFTELLNQLYWIYPKLGFIGG